MGVRVDLEGHEGRSSEAVYGLQVLLGPPCRRSPRGQRRQLGLAAAGRDRYNSRGGNGNRTRRRWFTSPCPANLLPPSARVRKARQSDQASAPSGPGNLSAVRLENRILVSKTRAAWGSVDRKTWGFRPVLPWTTLGTGLWTTVRGCGRNDTRVFRGRRCGLWLGRRVSLQVAGFWCTARLSCKTPVPGWS